MIDTYEAVVASWGSWQLIHGPLEHRNAAASGMGTTLDATVTEVASVVTR